MDIITRIYNYASSLARVHKCPVIFNEKVGNMKRWRWKTLRSKHISHEKVPKNDAQVNITSKKWNSDAEKDERKIPKMLR